MRRCPDRPPRKPSRKGTNVTRIIRRRYLIAALLAVAFTFTACSDKTLAAIAKEMPIIATANQGMLNTITTAAASGAITQAEATPLVQINLQIAQAGKQIDAAISGINSLTPAQKMTISAQITPIANAVTAEVANLQIANPTTKTTILATLTTLQGALAAITVAVGK